MSVHPHPRRRTRSAKRMVATAVGTLVLLNVGLTTYLCTFTHWRDPMFARPALAFNARLEQQPNERVAIAFLGSSRTGGGIDPRLVEPLVTKHTGRPCVAHNLHVPGAGPISLLFHVQRLIALQVPVDAVIVELSPLWYAMVDGRPYEYRNPAADRLSWAEVQQAIQFGFPAEEYQRDWYQATYNPWMGYRFQWLGNLKPSWLPPNVVRHERFATATLGHRPPFFNELSAEQKRDGLQRMRPIMYAPMQTVNFDDPPGQAMRKLVRTCREHGIVVGVFVVPLSDEFRSWYPLSVNERIRTFLETLHTDGATVSIDLRASLDNTLFGDGHHVVGVGVPAYSTLLAEQVVLPVLRQSGKVAP